MAIQSYDLGPGTLKIGTAGTAIQLEEQTTDVEIQVDESVTKGETFDVLSGGQLVADDLIDLGFKLVATALQALAANAIVDYSWTNAKTTKAFEFIPSTAGARKVSGNLRIVPLNIGGKVKTKPTSTFTWTILGTPTFTAV